MCARLRVARRGIAEQLPDPGRGPVRLGRVGKEGRSRRRRAQGLPVHGRSGRSQVESRRSARGRKSTGRGSERRVRANRRVHGRTREAAHGARGASRARDRRLLGFNETSDPASSRWRRSTASVGLPARVARSGRHWIRCSNSGRRSFPARSVRSCCSIRSDRC